MMNRTSRKTIRSLLKEWLERTADVHVLGRLPTGVDLFADLEQFVPWYRIQSVFDVGANIGQSAQYYLQRLPKVEIYCFEPASATYSKLVENVGRLQHIHCFHLALGSSPGASTLTVQANSSLNRVLLRGEEGLDFPTEQISVETLSAFCHREGIEEIGLLKIDTEGHDLEVLKGCGAMLEDQRIDLVQVEAGMNPHNKTHISMCELNGYLESRGYLLFGVYEQVHESNSRGAHLRRCNPIFISEKISFGNSRKIH